MTAHHARLKRVLAVLLAAYLLPWAPAALAQSGGGYDLSWSSVDGGGGTFSTGGAYALGGTAGQPDTGLLSGGSYTLAGGFWPGGTAGSAGRLYLPLVVRQSS